MKKLVPYGVVFLLGLALGAGVLHWIGAASNAALDRQRAELTRLTSLLHEQEATLAAGQTRLGEQATRIRQGLTRAVDLSDQVLKDQGSAVERLKKVISALRQLQVELKTLD